MNTELLIIIYLSGVGASILAFIFDYYLTHGDFKFWGRTWHDYMLLACFFTSSWVMVAVILLSWAEDTKDEII